MRCSPNTKTIAHEILCTAAAAFIVPNNIIVIKKIHWLPPTLDLKNYEEEEEMVEVAFYYPSVDHEEQETHSHRDDKNTHTCALPK